MRTQLTHQTPEYDDDIQVFIDALQRGNRSLLEEMKIETPPVSGRGGNTVEKYDGWVEMDEKERC